MLVLTRKPGQCIKIGEDIVIKYLQRDRSRRFNQISLGISAPKTINVVRTELLPDWEDPTNYPEFNNNLKGEQK